MPSLDALAAQITDVGPVYALLDAARSPAIIEHLKRSGEVFETLYDGRRAGQLAAVAPYLAQVSGAGSSPLLRALATEGWGQSWGVLLTAPVPLAELRRHFRRFLTVETEDGEALSFRFYDPRVLRPFVASATPDERRGFFGPVEAFFVEDPVTDGWLRLDRAGPAQQRPAPPWDLPRIRDEQCVVFARGLTEAFVERNTRRLEAALGTWAPDAEAAKALVVDAVARAEERGITAAGDVERYLDLVVALGPSFEDRLPWASTILARDDLEPSQKLARLERRHRSGGAGHAT